MRRQVLGTLAALALTLLVHIRSAHAVGSPPPLPPSFSEIQQGPDGGRVWQGRIPNTYVPSAWRPTEIYLPPDFSPQVRYPVVYLLQGFRGSPYQYVFGLSLARRADQLINAGEVRPFIAVIPPAGVTARFDGEWTGAWEDYLVRDVVPWADRHLPTKALAPGRVVAGLSGGGYGAVDIGLRHPRLFGTLESWSGSFTAPHDGSLAHAGATELAAHDPALLVRRDAPLLRRLRTRFFLSSGTGDRAAACATESFARELSSLRIAHRLWLGPGGHDGRFWGSQFAPALRYAVPEAPPSPTNP
jgi:enterochelin esterase-like enzyme